MNTLLNNLICQSYRSHGNVTLGEPHIPFLVLLKRSYRGWLSMMMSSRGPLSRLASGHSAAG